MGGRGLGRRIAVIAGAALLLGVPDANAAKPVIERIPLDETFVDEYLSEACGATIMTTVRGHLTIRTFPEGAPKVELGTISATATATGPGGTITFRNVGSDMVRLDRNGALTLKATGQVPFEFRGRLVVNLDTGEVIREPGRSRAGELEQACAALT